MKRAKINAMISRAGKLWYENSLFTGVAFKVDSDQVVLAYRVEQGLIIGDYKPLFSTDILTGNILSVDLSSDLADYDIQLYKNSAFSGIGYTFENNICDHEILVKNGAKKAWSWWNNYGQMIEFCDSNDEFGEIYDWNESGSLESASISTNDTYSAYISFDENGRLVRLRMNNGFLKDIKRISGRSQFFPLESRDDFISLRGAKEVSLDGYDIDGALFLQMVQHGALSQTSKISITDVHIDSLFIEALNFAANIKTIEFHGKVDCAIAAERIKRDEAGRLVFFNGVAIS